MEIVRLDANTLAVNRVDFFLLELFRGIPVATDPGEDEAGRKRLFTDPSADPASALNAEWKEYVEPDLRHLFSSAVETVAADLSRFADSPNEEPPGFRLTIPQKHLDAWLNCLNQARLVIAARHAFTEADLNDEFSIFASSPRDMGLFQVHFYGLLQESFLRLMEGA